MDTLVDVSLDEEMAIREELYGKLIRKFNKKENPQPFSSMMEILKSEGIKPVKLDIMAYSIDAIFEYYEEQKKLIKNLKIPQITVYGYGESNRKLDYDEGSISFVPLKAAHTAHFNIAYTEGGEAYLYYEPYHKGKYDFKIDFEKASEAERGFYAPELRKPDKKQLENIVSIYAL